MTIDYTRRRRIYHLLEVAHENDYASKFVDVLLIILIVLNVIAVVIETLPSLQGRYEQSFLIFDYFSAIVFAIEYGFRVWVCVEDASFRRGLTDKRARLKYILSPMAIVDLLAFLPSLLQIVVDADLRFLRILRLLRMFKLTRYSASMEMVLNVVRKEKNAFFAAFFVLMVLMVIAASGMYHVEHEVQPEAFASIPHAMWWAMVTLTTVGYGDIAPITPIGKLFGGMIIIGGVGLVALPAGIMASAFAEEMRIRRQSINFNIDTALEDGIIDEDEMQDLKVRAIELGVDEQEMNELIKLAVDARGKPVQQHSCPHCGESLE